MLAGAQAATPETTGDLAFVQISDSHIGFRNPPNPDPAGTLGEAIELVRQRRDGAELLIHTGDVSHLSRPAEFDTAEQLIRGAGLQTALRARRARRAGRRRPGRSSNASRKGDQGGRLVQLRPARRALHRPEQRAWTCKAGGLGHLGERAARLAGGRPARPVRQPADRGVRPCPALDGLPAMGLGHRGRGAGARLSQALRLGDRAERPHPPGRCRRWRATSPSIRRMSTAFPQPAPGTAPSPGPIRDLPAGRLRSLLGITHIREARGRQPLAIIDTPLGA